MIIKLSLQIKSFHDDLLQLAPWIDLSPVPENFDKLSSIDNIPTLLSIQEMPHWVLQHIDFYEQQENNATHRDWLNKMRECICAGSRNAEQRISLLNQLAEQCEEFSDADYTFLFEKATSLLRIGYNVEEQKQDNSSYDLLA